MPRRARPTAAWFPYPTRLRARAARARARPAGTRGWSEVPGGAPASPGTPSPPAESAPARGGLTRPQLRPRVSASATARGGAGPRRWRDALGEAGGPKARPTGGQPTFCGWLGNYLTIVRGTL